MATATKDLVLETVEVPVRGMDCAGCTRSVQPALTKLPGVHSADLLLSSEKAIVRLDRSRVDLAAVRRAVAAAGYSSPEPAEIPVDSAVQMKEDGMAPRTIRAEIDRMYADVRDRSTPTPYPPASGIPYPRVHGLSTWSLAGSRKVAMSERRPRGITSTDQETAAPGKARPASVPPKPPTGRPSGGCP
jgi:copper chaperone CopZ